MVRHDVTVGEVAAAVTAAASASPAGALADGGPRLRAGEERRSAEAIGDVTVRLRPDGTRLTVRDVAAVATEGVERSRALYVEGRPAVMLQVERAAGGDAVATQRLVERVIAETLPTLPEGVAITLMNTRAQAISDRLDILVWNGALGLALVLGFLFLFLSARTAFWVAAGIPAAMAAAVGLMFVAGLTLNMISLFALIICLGVVVDDAIVVGEHADHLARRGLSPTEAAEQAARRMFPAVFAATITTVIAFLGLVVIGGRFGAMILAIPLTVSMVLIASLAESFLVLPAHMRHALSAQNRAPWYDWPSRIVNRGFRRFREGLFRPAMRVALGARYAVLIGAVALLLHSLALVADGRLRWRFFDGPELASASANFAMLPGATRADTLAMMAELERALAAVAPRFPVEGGAPPVKAALAQVGAGAGRGLSGVEGKEADLLGAVSIELVDPDRRGWTQGDFLRAWEAETVRHPRLETLALRGERAGPGQDGVSVRLVGYEARVLKDAAEALKAELAAFPAVLGLEDTLAYDREELTLSLTPRGSALGLDSAALGEELRRRLAGVEAAAFPLEGRAAKVMVGLAEADARADYLDRAMIRDPAGGWSALADLATVSRSLSFSTIRREDGFPVITVSGEIDAADPAAAEAVRAALVERILPDLAARFDVDWSLAGLAEQERRFLADARVGFLMCLAGIYVALAWLFGSWSRPFVVLLAVPLGLIGVTWGHHWLGVSLSMFSVVGMIGMTGIVINDSIVLVRAVDEHAATRPLRVALVDGAADRLRAVFLTTATTVAGLAPMLFETSTQAQFLKPTVITLAFGLGFGMVLVLFVTPALIAVQHDVASALRALRRLPGALRRRGRLRRA
jgi:multidrug efflux pump subunit AcrB